MAATAEDILLCRLTGELWATFAPWRGPWNGGGATAAYLGRRAFRNRAGLRWRNKGRDREEREAILTVLGQLERSGLLVRRIEQTRVVAVRLSEAGIGRACGLAGAPCWFDGRTVCEQLAACDDTQACMTHLGKRWIAEWALAGTPPFWAGCGGNEVGRANRRLLSVLEEKAIPALIRGWLESGADLHGRVWYATTDAGRDALAEAPPDEPKDINADDDCALAWREGAHTMQVRLAAAPRSEREIGLLPLPVHGGPTVGDDVGPRRNVSNAGGRNHAAAAHVATGANVGGDMAATRAADSRPGRPSTRTRRTDS